MFMKSKLQAVASCDGSSTKKSKIFVNFSKYIWSPESRGLRVDVIHHLLAQVLELELKVCTQTAFLIDSFQICDAQSQKHENCFNFHTLPALNHICKCMQTTVKYKGIITFPCHHHSDYHICPHINNQVHKAGDHQETPDVMLQILFQMSKSRATQCLNGAHFNRVQP